MQWDEPFYSNTGGLAGAQSDLDVYLCKSASTTTCSKGYTNNVGQDAGEWFTASASTLLGAGVRTGTLYLGINVWSSSRTADIRVKFLFWYMDVVIKDAAGNNQMTFSTDAPQVNTPGERRSAPGSCVCQPPLWPRGSNSDDLARPAAATLISPPAAGMSVGAAYYGNTPRYGVTPATLESYSSWGTTTVYLDSTGNRLATPVVNRKPDFVAPGGSLSLSLGPRRTATRTRPLSYAGTSLTWLFPGPRPRADGTQTSFFYGTNSDGTHTFFGTSAAAPHAGVCMCAAVDAWRLGPLTWLLLAWRFGADALVLCALPCCLQPHSRCSCWSATPAARAPQSTRRCARQQSR